MTIITQDSFCVMTLESSFITQLEKYWSIKQMILYSVAQATLASPTGAHSIAATNIIHSTVLTASALFDPTPKRTAKVARNFKRQRVPSTSLRLACDCVHETRHSRLHTPSQNMEL